MNLTPEDATASEEVSVPVSELLQGDTNFFDFQRGEGNGILYYTMRLNSAIAVDHLDPISRGFTLERRYYDAACDLDYVRGAGKDAEPEYVVSNSFGFGGINAALLFRRESGSRGAR